MKMSAAKNSKDFSAGTADTERRIKELRETGLQVHQPKAVNDPTMKNVITLI